MLAAPPIIIQNEFRELAQVLDEPAMPIEPAIMQTCIRLFTFLVTGDVKEDTYCSGGPNTVSFSFMHHFDKIDGLAWVIKLCNRFLDKDSIDPAVLAELPQYDKAAEVIRTFLKDIAENGKYEFEEDIT